MMSVVVPTYRRDDLLRRCLERLLVQSCRPNGFEIIVADDGPSESTRALVEAMQPVDGPKLRYLPVPRTQGPAGARNVGWRAARGAMIAFTDDDCLPQPNWLAEGLAALQLHKADAATGRTIVPLRKDPSDYERDAAGLGEAEFITANCFCRRNALRHVGGFDERFCIAWREDSDVQFSLLERGMKIVRAERAVVIHPIRPAPWGVSLRQQHKGYYDALLFRKHPDLFRRRVPCFPRSYYAAAASLSGAILAAAAGWHLAAIAAMAGWVTITMRFAVCRLRGTSRAPSHIMEMLVTSAIIPLLSVYWRLRGAWRFRAVVKSDEPRCRVAGPAYPASAWPAGNNKDCAATGTARPVANGNIAGTAAARLCGISEPSNSRTGRALRS